VAFNINDFKATMDRFGGPARLSMFEVEIAATSLDGTEIAPGIITTRDLRFFCQSVSVPGVNLETTTYRPSGIGFPESIPTSSAPEALNCVFILDNEHRILTFFHRWMNTVMNVGSARGNTDNGLPIHQIEYKNSYAASSLIVRHYSSTNVFNSYEFEYLSVYPTQVGNIDLGWGSKDAIATITVNFSYSKMAYEGFRNRNITNPTFIQ
jgi:hypothetical protein